jgi:type II secretory pathway component PulC
MTETRFKQTVALVSGLCLAGAIGLAVRVLVFPPAILTQPMVVPPAPEPVSPKTPPRAAEMSRTILANDIFGLRPATEAAKPAEPPKKTDIDMDLTGTVVTADPEKNVAFLRDRSGKSQKPYTVGASVKDATIKSIGKNFVILTRQGREEILSMKP